MMKNKRNLLIILSVAVVVIAFSAICLYSVGYIGNKYKNTAASSVNSNSIDKLENVEGFENEKNVEDSSTYKKPDQINSIDGNDSNIQTSKDTTAQKIDYILKQAENDAVTAILILDSEHVLSKNEAQTLIKLFEKYKAKDLSDKKILKDMTREVKNLLTKEQKDVLEKAYVEYKKKIQDLLNSDQKKMDELYYGMQKSDSKFLTEDEKKQIDKSATIVLDNLIETLNEIK